MRLLVRVLVCLLLCAGAVRAEEPGSCGSSSPEASALHIVLSGEFSETRLHQAVCDWFDGDAWAVHFEAAVWRPRATLKGTDREKMPTLLTVQRAPDGEVRIAAQQWGQPYTSGAEHRMALADGLDATGLEMIAQAIHSLAQLHSTGLLSPPVPDGNAPGNVPRTWYPSGSNAPSPLQESDHQGALVSRLALGFRALSRGAEPSSFGPDGALELSWTGLALPVTLRLQVHSWDSPSQAVERSLRLRLLGSTITLGIASRLQLLTWLHLQATTGLSYERVVARVQGRQDDTSLQAVAHGISHRYFAEMATGLAVPWRQLELRLQGLLRAQLRPSPYQLLAEQERVELFAPATFQPGVELQVAYAW